MIAGNERGARKVLDWTVEFIKAQTLRRLLASLTNVQIAPPGGGISAVANVITMPFPAITPRVRSRFLVVAEANLINDNIADTPIFTLQRQGNGAGAAVVPFGPVLNAQQGTGTTLSQTLVWYDVAPALPAGSTAWIYSLKCFNITGALAAFAPQGYGGFVLELP